MFDDSFFDDFEDLESWFFGDKAGHRESEAGRSQLTHDVWESDSRIFVTLELPGAKENDIEYQISANRLFIKVRENSSAEQSGYYATIRLPSAVKERPVSKTFKNGVLELIWEKSNGSTQKGQRIEVR
ncbi:MAG: Hsp20/alpha crystallin family protein [Candidatus Diapherotrites archaeon]